MQCKECGKEFFPNRDWQECCSKQCRQLYWRKEYRQERRMEKLAGEGIISRPAGSPRIEVPVLPRRRLTW
jgi:hypothetical protein